MKHLHPTIFALTASLASALTPLACGDLSSSSSGSNAAIPGDASMHRAMLTSLAYNAIAPSYEAAAAAATSLEAATSTYATAAAAGSGTDEQRAAAQTAWTDAVMAWEVVEQMQLGPAAPTGSGVGGAGKRDEIYSWPTVNPCRIDQELVEQGYLQGDFFTANLVNTYGLDALEYLLFYGGDANACAPQLPLNVDGTWAALGPDEIAKRRANYATAVATALATEAAGLAQAWSAADGPFTVALADPDLNNSPYGTVRAGLNEVVRAMFYLDLEVKDDKLGVPAGVLECAAAPCIADLEFVHAQRSKDAVLANLEGFKRLFHGGTDAAQHTGFDDLLVSIGEAPLAASMAASIETALTTCGAVEGSFAAALTSEPAALNACHTAVREVTNWLKGDFSTLLMLSIPSEAAGDAD